MPARRALVMIVVAALLAAWAGEASAGQRYKRMQRFALSEGVVHEAWSASASLAPIHAVVIPPGSSAKLRIVAARGGVYGGRESVSSMCARTPGCIAGVNGDYFTATGPVGGMIAGGRMLRSPKAGHPQLSLRPLRVNPGGISWEGVAVGGSRRVVITQLNRPPGPDQVALYTSAHGPSTHRWPAACGCRELGLTGAGGKLGQLSGGVVMATSGWSTGGSELSQRRGVLVGRGKGVTALQELAAQGRGKVEVSIRTSAPTTENLGAHPIIMRGERRAGYSREDPVLSARHPRTAIGWDAKGRVVLLAADGRRPGGAGYTADEMVEMLRVMGAGAAVLADGGGSTTMVVRGRVVNTPSDGRERLVANAVLVVGKPPKVLPAKAGLRGVGKPAAPQAAKPAAPKPIAKPAAPKTVKPAAPKVAPKPTAPKPETAVKPAAPPAPERARLSGQQAWAGGRWGMPPARVGRGGATLHQLWEETPAPAPAVVSLSTATAGVDPRLRGATWVATGLVMLAGVGLVWSGRRRRLWT